jgi:transposase-like protein
LNKKVKRRADVVGIFPNEDSNVRLIGAVLLEANDEWQLQHRYM